jgi:hypothetical protein
MSLCMSQIDFPCVCGHAEKDHLDIYGDKVAIFCNECCLYNFYNMMRTNYSRVENFHKFKIDNLKYLEELSKE